MSARNYSIPNLFRQMPNGMLARYFKREELFQDLDFAAMKEAKPEALVEAWLDLPDEDKNPRDAQLREVFEMSCEKGFLAILDEAKEKPGEASDEYAKFSRKLSGLKNHYARAMTTFLDHPELLKVAALFFHADNLPHWRKRKNMPKNPPSVDQESLAELESLISAYFHRSEGRGKHCRVEFHRRSDRDYFFAYPEDHSQQSAMGERGIPRPTAQPSL